MSRTHTRLIDYQKLQASGKSGVLVVKLMMACNDLQLANETLTAWAEKQPRNRKHRETGARIYFIRLQIAHLFEALNIVEEIQHDTDLIRMIEQSDSQTRQSFGRLKAFLRGGSRRRWFEQKVGRIRNNVTFHYEETGTLIERAIADIASRHAGRTSPITRGDTAYLWYFQTADEISDNIVRRQIWGIPRDVDLKEATEKILDEIHQQVFVPFVDFAGELLWKATNR